MNKSVDGYSEAVIYDNTSPLVGKMEVKSTGMKGFVASHQLSMEWSDIEDMESGIHTIEIGIGSSNMSADIVQFAEYVSYAEIDMHDCFQDGHQYFAILKVLLLNVIFKFTYETNALVII
jgi:hypothetical protein